MAPSIFNLTGSAPVAIKRASNWYVLPFSSWTLLYTDSHAGAIPALPLRDAHDAAAARDDSVGQKRDYASAIKRYFVTRTFNHSHLNLALNQHLGVRIPRGQPIPSCGSPS